MSTDHIVNEKNVCIICGPSGSGKSTLYHRLLADYPELRFSVSATTRKARPAELDGRDYYFLSREAFDDLLARDAFAESAMVHGNMYGTLKEELASKSRDAMCILDIDIQGARSIKALYPGVRSVFIAPPDIDALIIRLKRRETETDEEMAVRIANAEKELAVQDEFEYIIINTDIDTAYTELQTVISQLEKNGE
jgi:guanylate kinase